MRKIDPRVLQNLEIQNTPNQTSNEQNILALDYGEKFSGLAFSTDGICAIPLKVVATTDLESEIQDILIKKSVHKLVIGLPLLPDESENSLCPIIRDFGKKFTTVPIIYVNERYSSRMTIPLKNERIDDLAAAQILEFYFRGHSPL